MICTSSQVYIYEEPGLSTIKRSIKIPALKKNLIVTIKENAVKEIEAHLKKMIIT